MPLPPVVVLLFGCFWMIVLQSVLYGVQQARRNGAWADVGWAAGLGSLAVHYAMSGDAEAARRTLLAVVAGAWSLRLAAHLLITRALVAEEDGRYQRMRERWGKRAQLYFLVYFQMQGAWAVLFSLPLLVVAYNRAPAWAPWDFAALAVAFVAITGEAVADVQLARWRAQPDNRGKTCREGLWRVSRHPNYFFEWLHWWAYVLLGIGSRFWWVTLIGPVVMLLLLLKVTGIPVVEEQALATRGDDYRDYQQFTSAFLPWPPRRSGE